jgi:hypothetical protein
LPEGSGWLFKGIGFNSDFNTAMKEYYSLLLVPPRHFSDQVRKLKEALRIRLGEEYPGTKAPAHLSICSFSAKAGICNNLIESIGIIVQTLPILSLRTGKTVSFPSSGTLFISIREAEIYTVFQNMLVFELRTLYPALKRSMSIPSKPHFTLAKGIPSGLLAILEEEMKEAIEESDLIMPELRLMFKKDGKMTLFHSWKLEGQPV